MMSLLHEGRPHGETNSFRRSGTQFWSRWAGLLCRYVCSLSLGIWSSWSSVFCWDG